MIANRALSLACFALLSAPLALAQQPPAAGPSAPIRTGRMNRHMDMRDGHGRRRHGHRAPGHVVEESRYHHQRSR